MVFGHILDEPGFWRQLFCSIIGSMTGPTAGIYLAYVATALPSFDGDKDAPFKMSEGDKSFYTSLPAITAIPGSFIAGFLTTRFGRKAVLHWSLLPCIAGWLWNAYGTTYAEFLISRGLIGFIVGILVPAGQLYLVEISTPATRGFISSMTMLWQVFFNLVQYVVGSFTSWKELAIINAVLHILYFPIGFFVVETPTWFLSQQGREEEARKALKFLRGSNSTEAVEREITGIKKLMEQTKDDAATCKDVFQWQYLKSLVLLSTFITFRQFTGIFAIVSYTVDIFEEAGGAVKPEVSTIIVGTVQLVFVAVSNSLTDKVGRKLLTAGSAITMALSHGVFGMYYFMHSHDEWKETAKDLTWVPLVALVVFMIGFSLGFASAFYVLMGEMIPHRIKDHASGFASVVNNVTNFAVLELYFPMKHGLTEAGTFWFYAAVCLLAAIFCVCLLPETKGKTLQELEEKLTQSRRRSQANVVTLETQTYTNSVVLIDD